MRLLLEMPTPAGGSVDASLEEASYTPPEVVSGATLDDVAAMLEREATFLRRLGSRIGSVRDAMSDLDPFHDGSITDVVESKLEPEPPLVDSDDVAGRRPASKAPTREELRDLERSLNGPAEDDDPLPTIVVFGGDSHRLSQQVKWDPTRATIEFVASTRHDKRSDGKLADRVRRGAFDHVIVMSGWAGHHSGTQLRGAAKASGTDFQMAPTNVGASWLTGQIEQWLTDRGF